MLEKCPDCGSTDLEEDPSRGNVLCQGCGVVLEENMTVSTVQFEQTGSGQSEALGHFLAADATSIRLNNFHNQSSRELTIYKARMDIKHLCYQLKMLDHQVDLAVNFYKQVLHYNLTRGRNRTLTYAGCIYLACRIEKTPHLLIDISDVTQIDVYELGRTYLKFVKALYLENSVDGAISIDSEDSGNSESIKAVDPCLYVMRFAEKLDFGAEKMKVVKTALRLVSRMKKDNIHTGRRPSGICGAALLIAARMHDFNRTVGDIIKVVKIHESTLKKRLMEFGDTPASALTLDDFEAVDVDGFAEEDPPAFKAARKAEEKLKEVNMEEIDEEFTDLQKEIDKYLTQQQQQSRKRPLGIMMGSFGIEDAEVNRVIQKTTQEIAKDFVDERGLGPDISAMGLPNDFYERRVVKEGSRFEKYNNESGEIDLEGIDDEELDGYILKDADVVKKTELWTTCNAEFLELQKKREEQRLQNEAEGKPAKKRRVARKKEEPANSAGEAVEKMMKEKKLSKKLNYDVIREMKGETIVKFGKKQPVVKNDEDEEEERNGQVKVCDQIQLEDLFYEEPEEEEVKETNGEVKVYDQIQLDDLFYEEPKKKGAKKEEEEEDDGDDYDNDDDEEEEEEEDPVDNVRKLINKMNGNEDDDCDYGSDYYDDY